MDAGIPTEPPAAKPPSRRAKQRERRARAQADGKCTATAKSTGRRCTKTPEPDRSTCWRHGAKGGRPIIHGRYSELPERIRVPYQASLNDPTLLDLTQTIAILDGLARLHGARLKEGDTPGFRERALELVDEMIAEKGQPDGAAGKCLQRLITHLRAGAEETRAEEFFSVRVERVSRRIEEFHRIKLARQNVINAGDLMKVMQMLCAAIQRLVPAELAKQLVEELQRILGDVDAVDIGASFAGRN